VELQALNTLYREEGRRKTLLEAEAALREELARLEERHARIERAPALEEEATLELEKKRGELEDAQGLLEARRTEWVRDRQEAQTKREALRQQYSELKHQRDRVVAVGEDGECPTCARPLGGSLHTVVEHLEDSARLRPGPALRRDRGSRATDSDGSRSRTVPGNAGARAAAQAGAGAHRTRSHARSIDPRYATHQARSDLLHRERVSRAQRGV